MALVVLDRPLVERYLAQIARDGQERLSRRWRMPNGERIASWKRRQIRRGALVVPDVGEVQMLARALYSSVANLTLKLYKTNVTPGESDTHSSYTVADFTNYVNKTITATQSGSTWSAAATAGGTTSSTYGGGTPQSWTCGASGNTIYGYWLENATPVLFWSELFATARAVANGDTLNLTPYIECA